MDGWFMYLGQVVWRISGHPTQLEEDSRDEGFWFRTYGLLTVFLSLGILLTLIFATGEPLEALVRTLDDAMGVEKALFQTVLAVMLMLLIGIPSLLVATALVASVVGILGGLPKFIRFLYVRLQRMLRGMRQPAKLGKKMSKASRNLSSRRRH